MTITRRSAGRPRSRTDTDEVLAGELATGAEESGQEFDRVDSTIAFATVDNENYAYTVRCSISATNTSVAILGTTVDYSVTGLPVE